MKTIIISIMAFSAIAIAACSKTDNHSNTTVTSSDSVFAIKASQANIAEIEAGQVSLTNSSNDSVMMFGQMMITDHTKAKVSLDSIGNLLHFGMPTTPDAAHIVLKLKLMALHGLAFDSTYLNSQVTDHQMVLAMLSDEMNNGTNAMLKAYASKNYPIVQMHLLMADSLQAELMLMR